MKQSPHPKEFLSVDEVATQTPYSRNSIYRLVKNNIFPKPIKFGSKSLWLQKDIDKWMADRIKDTKATEIYLDNLKNSMAHHPFINALDNYIGVLIEGVLPEGIYATIEATNKARTDLMDELTKLIKEELPLKHDRSYGSLDEVDG